MGYKTKPVRVLKTAEINNPFQRFYPLSTRSINTTFSFSVWENFYLRQGWGILVQV